MIAYKAKSGILTFLRFDMDPIAINQNSEMKNPQSDPNPIPAAAQSNTRFWSSRSLNALLSWVSDLGKPI